MSMKMFVLKASLFVVLAFSFETRAEVLSVYKTPTGTGWLERSSQGDQILHLEGSYYDMGYEHAMLLRKETGAAIRSLKHALHHHIPFLPTSWVIAALDELVYRKQEPFIPNEFKDEMRGLSDAGGVPLRLIHATHALTYLTSCAGIAAWGSATKDGELYFGRSNDAFVIIDPQTKKSFHDLGMIVIYKPINGIPYMMISWPGYIGASDGMNAEGIALCNMSDPSKHETPAGVPMIFRLKQTLAKSHNLKEAINWITEKPFEGGYNFIVADAKIPSAAVVEMDAMNVYVGNWDGPAESNRYIYKGKEYRYSPMRDLLLRTNHPLSSDLIASHKNRIDDDRRNWLTVPRYRDLRDRLIKQYGSLDLETMNEILRSHYQAMNYSNKATLGATTHQFVMKPKTGDFLVAFCKGNPLLLGRKKVSAFNQPVHRYNFFDLLNSKPEQY